MALYIKEFSYAGDSNDGRAENLGIDLTNGSHKRVVMIWSNANQFSCFKTGTMEDTDGDATAYFTNSASNPANFIQTFTATGITLGNANQVNATGTNYYGLVIVDTTGDYLDEGQYTGTGSGKNITTTFDPDFTLCKRDGASIAVYKTLNTGGTVSNRFNGSSASSNNITALGTLLFSIGTDAQVNSSGQTYNWFALKLRTGVIALGTIAGDGNDDRSIPATDIDPNMVWVDRNETGSSTTGQMTSKDLLSDAGELSIDFHNGAGAANRIQSLGTASFVVGTDTRVNANTVNYEWSAFTNIDEINVVTTTVVSNKRTLLGVGT